MILITGGAYQGKTGYAKKAFNIVSSDIADGRSCTFEAAKSAACIVNFHELVRRLTEAGIDCIGFTNELCRENLEAVIILDEIGSGIIPLDKSERKWRESVGRCGCILAENAETVIRLVCGIPTAIKGELP